jgi:hypothetical protein
MIVVGSLTIVEEPRPAARDSVAQEPFDWKLVIAVRQLAEWRDPTVKLSRGVSLRAPVRTSSLPSPQLVSASRTR